MEAKAHGDLRYLERFSKLLNPKEIASLSKEEKQLLCERLVRNSIRNLKKTHYGNGDDIGYMFSVHHDTKNTHAHLYVFPYTEKGNYIAMNAQRYLTKDQIKKTGRKTRASTWRGLSKATWLKTDMSRRMKKEYQFIRESNTKTLTPVRTDFDPQQRVKRRKHKQDLGLDI